MQKTAIDKLTLIQQVVQWVVLPDIGHNQEDSSGHNDTETTDCTVY